MDIDFGKTAQDYGRYRAGFPEELFTRLTAFGIGIAGQRVLDLGTGTGMLARGFARRGCAVTGLDSSVSLIEEAKRLDQKAGVSIRYVIAKSEQTGLPDASFDVVTAEQCWHWFDRPKAAQEVLRLLMPRGWLVIAHFAGSCHLALTILIPATVIGAALMLPLGSAKREFQVAPVA